jgi:hypothetical protein
MPGCMEFLMMPTILGGLHGIRAAETTNFKVVVSPLRLTW